MVQVNRIELDRNKVDLSDETVAHAWVKHLGRSREEIAKAIAKVGHNADTVRKELGCEKAGRGDSGGAENPHAAPLQPNEHKPQR